MSKQSYWITFYLKEGHTLSIPAEFDDFYKWKASLGDLLTPGSANEDEEFMTMLEEKYEHGYDAFIDPEDIVAIMFEPREK